MTGTLGVGGDNVTVVALYALKGGVPNRAENPLASWNSARLNSSCAWKLHSGALGVGTPLHSFLQSLAFLSKALDVVVFSFYCVDL